MELKNPHPFNVEEMAAKQAEREQLRNATQSSVQASGGYAVMEPSRQPMRDRFDSEAGRLEKQSKKAAQLRELVYLLDKNPEVARILDLFDAVQ